MVDKTFTTGRKGYVSESQTLALFTHLFENNFAT